MSALETRDRICTGAFVKVPLDSDGKVSWVRPFCTRTNQSIKRASLLSGKRGNTVPCSVLLVAPKMALTCGSPCAG